MNKRSWLHRCQGSQQVLQFRSTMKNVAGVDSRALVILVGKGESIHIYSLVIKYQILKCFPYYSCSGQEKNC